MIANDEENMNSMIRKTAEKNRKYGSKRTGKTIGLLNFVHREANRLQKYIINQ